MINLDDQFFDKINEKELWLIVHVAKRMRSWRLKAWPSLRTIAKDCGWSKNTARQWRDSLKEKEIIGMNYRPGTTPEYFFLVPGIGVHTPLKDVDPAAERDFEDVPKVGTPQVPKNGTPVIPEVGTEGVPEVGTQKGVNNKKGVNNGKGVSAELCKLIIDDLNKRLGTKYQHTKQDTVEKITARVNEGWMANDFILVNEYKVAQWREDERMRDYLRPETLYCKKHFEGYLQQAIMAQKKDKGAPAEQTTVTPMERGMQYAVRTCTEYAQVGKDIVVDAGMYDVLSQFLLSLQEGQGRYTLEYTQHLDKFKQGRPAAIAAQYAKAEAIMDWLRSKTWVNDHFRNLFRQLNQRKS